MVLDDGFVPVMVCGKSAVRAATLLHVFCPCFHCWWHGVSRVLCEQLSTGSCFSLGRGGYFLSVGLFLQSLPQRGSIYHVAETLEQRGG
jgi:hypothetical protein